MALDVQHIDLMNVGDDDGVLLWQERRLIAVLSQLGPLHEDKAKLWHVEWFAAGETGLADYADLDKACIAIEERIPDLLQVH